MRILHVSDCYQPRVGGIEVQVADLAAAQAARGHRVEVLTATPGGPDSGPVRVHRTSGLGTLGVLRAIRPDAVHVHASLVSPLATSAAAAAVRMRLPVVVTAHSVWGRWARAVYRAADVATGWGEWPIVWTAVSTAAAATMRPLLPSGPQVVPNAVDLAFWKVAAAAPRPGSGLHVVAVGRLAPRKRPMDLVRVLRDARQWLPSTVPLRATVIGDGPERGRVARYVAGHGMAPWVRLTGNLDARGIRRVLAGADAFLAPAVLESFGIAALEARTAGLAVVARAGTGVADVVRHGREGLLAPDRDGLADALVRLATEPELAGSISANNRRSTPDRFGWPAVVAAMDGCYALAGAPLTPPRAARRPTPRPTPSPARSPGRA